MDAAVLHLGDWGKIPLVRLILTEAVGPIVLSFFRVAVIE